MNIIQLSEREKNIVIAIALDTDGSISMGNHPYKRVELTAVSNINEEFVVFIQQAAGYGKIRSYKQSYSKRTIHHLSIPKRHQLDFLERVLEFLIVKRERAEEAIRFLREGRK